MPAFYTYAFQYICLVRDEEENCVMLLSVATALIDHTDSLLLQCSRLGYRLTQLNMAVFFWYI